MERKVTGKDSVIVEEARNVEALTDHVGKDVRNVLLKMGAEEQANSLDEEEVVMEIAEVIERDRKDKLPALRNGPKNKFLEETAKVHKILREFKTHGITETNELFYAGAVVLTNTRIRWAVGGVAPTDHFARLADAAGVVEASGH